jgi:hydroxymethylpyrimidine pyrophosphatase-like HAD family hydrolase
VAPGEQSYIAMEFLEGVTLKHRIDLSAECRGVGDAESDDDLLSLCGCSVAVANAIPALKQRADVVTGCSYRAGALEVIQRFVDKDNLG